jgi:hypothetical protein
MPRKLPNFICSHVPMEIFLFYESGKNLGNQNRVCLRKGRFPYLCVLSGGPPSRECTCAGTSPRIKRLLALHFFLSSLPAFFFENLIHTSNHGKKILYLPYANRHYSRR